MMNGSHSGASSSPGRDHDDPSSSSRRVIATPMAAGAANTAMKLFENYSSLNRAIDNTRKEMKQTRAEIEEIQGKIQMSRQERDSMKQRIVLANKETSEFHHQIDQANDELLELDLIRASMKKQQAERELQHLKDYRDKQYHEFKEASREFRAEIRRNRLCCATELGLERVHTKAFATVLATDSAVQAMYSPEAISVSPNVFDEGNKDMYQPAVEHGGVVPFAESPNLKTDPRLWTPDPRDEVMKAKLSVYCQQISKREKEIQEVEALRDKCEAAKNKAQSRARNMQQLEAQRDRIKNDVMEMEQKIESLKQETEETEALAQTYEKQVKCKRLALAQARFENGASSSGAPDRNPRPTAAAVAQNPYKNRNNGTSNSGCQSSSSRGGGRPAYQNQQSTSTSRQQQQHPRREGRIRVNRQFTTNLSILEPDAGRNDCNEQRGSLLDNDSDSDDELLSFTPFPKRP
ncbi:expressed unknown protein [Seminavis robusta]|uniref:Uncharacterized protein n=1 Tax=Seminavis robusta TaxID=568900 RepID=A0A9N8DQR7_9STRA|nr:expressed unknown protein [Seminavis robusta]|eukprot:Sro216_g089210.1 n/a (463) ;mRNA; r:7242-8722